MVELLYTESNSLRTRLRFRRAWWDSTPEEVCTVFSAITCDHLSCPEVLRGV